jgi:hypothetical protein
LKCPPSKSSEQKESIESTMNNNMKHRSDALMSDRNSMVAESI